MFADFTTTAPPKPSAQTQILLATMEERSKKDDEKWDEVMEHLDLLFAKVGNMEQKQEALGGITSKVLDQLLQGQQRMSKQIEANGQAIAKLTLNQNNSPPSPTSSDTSEDLAYHRRLSRDSAMGS